MTALRVLLEAQGIAIADSQVISGTDAGQVRSRLATVLDPPAAASAAGPAPTGSARSIALLDAAAILNAPPLGAVLDDPRVSSGALSAVPETAARDAAAPGQDQVFLGVLKLAGPDRPAAAALLHARPAPHSATTPRGLPGPPAAGVPADEPLLDLTRSLTAAGVPVQPVAIGGYAWARPVTAPDSAAAAAAIGAVDERTVRLREAARGGDGFYSTFVLRRVSWRLTSVAERIGLTPNQVTLISFALGLLAAGCLAVGDRGWSVAGALLLQVCLVVDCVDGELARYRRRFSRFGAWLDATTDRVKEFAAIAALAVAGHRHGQDLWFLVAAAIAVQTFRNLLDLGWSLQRKAVAAPVVAPSPNWVAPATSIRPPSGRPGGPGALSWARRVGHFPIGERFLVLSLGAALWSPRATLITLLVVGLLSAGYMLAAFGVRGRGNRPAAGAGSGAGASSDGPAAVRRILDLADAGPGLAALLRKLGGATPGRLVAVLPAVVAVLELALAWWLAATVADAEPAAGLVLVAVIAIAHYQQAYGVREDGDEAGGLVLGTDLRLIGLIVVILVPEQWASGAVWILAALVAVSSTTRSLRAWLGRGSGPDPASSAHPTLQPETIGGQR